MNPLTWFENAAEGVTEAVCNAFATLISMILNFVLELYIAQFQLLPSLEFDFTQADLSTFIDVISGWNKFVPISESFIMIMMLLVFASVFGCVKIIVKLIPTVG